MMAFAFVALIIAIAIVAYEMNDSLGPQYRKGCNECDAAKRREAEHQRELQHDYAHRLGGKTDRYHCGDDECPRNPRTGA